MDFVDKKIYFDYPRDEEFVKRLSKKILALGGVVEEFLTSDVDLFVAKKSDLDYYCKKSLIRPSMFGNANQRGQALLLKSVRRCGSYDVLSAVQKARKLGIRLFPYEDFKTMLDCVSISDNNNNAGLIVSSRDSPIHRFKHNFLKFQGTYNKFCPHYKEFSKWPIMSFVKNYPSSPFEDFEIQQKCNSIRSSGSLKKFPKASFIKKRHYCEACKLEYTDLTEHISGPDHNDFATNKENFKELDNLILTFVKQNSIQSSGVMSPRFVISDEQVMDTKFGLSQKYLESVVTCNENAEENMISCSSSNESVISQLCDKIKLDNNKGAYKNVELGCCFTDTYDNCHQFTSSDSIEIISQDIRNQLNYAVQVVNDHLITCNEETLTDVRLQRGDSQQSISEFYLPTHCPTEDKINGVGSTTEDSIDVDSSRNKDTLNIVRLPNTDCGEVLRAGSVNHFDSTMRYNMNAKVFVHSQSAEVCNSFNEREGEIDSMQKTSALLFQEAEIFNSTDISESHVSSNQSDFDATTKLKLIGKNFDETDKNDCDKLSSNVLPNCVFTKADHCNREICCPPGDGSFQETISSSGYDEWAITYSSDTRMHLKRIMKRN